MIPWRFFAGLAILYALLVLIIVCAISPYFSVGWDPQIFAGAGRAIIDNHDVFDVYQVSRQAWGDWGYPYPPLYAQLLAPLIGLTVLVPVLPDWLIVRTVPVLFDLTLAVLVYLIVRRRRRDERLSRLAAALTLFNPLMLYQTAIQAHQESTWLVCAVAAFALVESAQDPSGGERGWRDWLRANAALPSLLMALAVTFKQSAILFYVPYAVYLFLGHERRWPRLLLAGGLLAVVLGGMSLPYVLHSSDYVYLVLVDVSNMPVQTQSAVVWLLALKSFLINQTQSRFFLLKYQVPITILLTAGIAFIALRKDRDLFRAGLLTAFVFFLTSKKVMGYHYPLLVPFLLIYALPGDRFDLMAIGMIAASWIIVSPYFAPWAKPQHLALYASIATPNTLLWLWFLVHVGQRRPALALRSLDVTARLRDGGAAVLSIVIITAGMALSCLAQPWASGRTIVQVTLLVVVLALSLLAGPPIARRIWDRQPRVTPGHVALALLLIPVYFAAFAMTSESTQIIEGLLQ